MSRKFPIPVRMMLLSLLFLLLATDAVAWITPPHNLRLLETDEGWARLQWDVVDSPALAGYRLKYSLTPGVHPDMVDWNGYDAAFTFTTDDGYMENMVWMKVFDRHDRDFTAFVIPARIGMNDFMTVADLDTFHAHGHEVASHTYSHPVLLRPTAFTVSYTGTAGSCMLEISNDTLRSYLDGTILDLEFPLSDTSSQYCTSWST